MDKQELYELVATVFLLIAATFSVPTILLLGAYFFVGDFWLLKPQAACAVTTVLSMVVGMYSLHLGGKIQKRKLDK